jgi:SnoaL-like domain
MQAQRGLTMPQPLTVDHDIIPDSLYLGIQHFYSRQMHALDAGEADAWAATFTEDGEFAANAHAEPTRGRAALAAAARANCAELARQNVVRRHWLGMLTVRPLADEKVHARCYALVIATPKAGKPELAFSTLCEDTLVREGETWLVQQRTVTRDDL